MNRLEAFEEINRTQDEYIEELIDLINNPDYKVMKSVNFTSPTGTGKTKMMSKLINHFPEYYFIVTTLSRGQLHFQVRNELSVDCIKDNYYVYGSADYRINSKLEANDIIGRIPPDTPCIWLRDEGHIKTNRFDELLKTHCYKVINFSATNEYSDIKCNFTNTMMLRTVNQSCGTPKDAILKLIDVKKAHRAISGYNPCAIFRCVGNDKKLYERIITLCNDYDLKYIDLIDNTPDVTIAELCKDDSEYDVIINKFKITEGIDIKRAHVLYMDNKPNNNATTIQVIGRCRRNALLYRNDIDILAQENKSLLEKTRECYVFYNVEKYKIDLDENGELQYAFCDHISCEELKPNTVVEVVNGQLPNGLYILELDEDIYVKYLECDGNLTIKGNKKLTINGLYDCLYVDGTLNISGATISVTDTSDYKNMSAIVAEKINLSGGSTIIKPEGGTVKEFSSSLMDVDVNNYSRETIVDSSGKPAKEVEIAVKKDTPEPEKAADETPIQEEEKTTDSGKKSYKNEWVNGQWYDANGKTSYKYKGGWKVNGTGWWYEDENGWFPTNMWQKIDGDWYFFHEDGYMAENEYAGKWELYSEGYWWVGSDGRWDGSEPGVWRLSGTKWWFKDSTGWFAKGKWYRIGGKWYEFDNDGWWIEPE